MKGKISVPLDTEKKAGLEHVLRAKNILNEIDTFITWEEVLNEEKGGFVQAIVYNKEEAIALINQIEKKFDGYGLSIQQSINLNGSVTLTIPTHVTFSIGEKIPIIPATSQTKMATQINSDLAHISGIDKTDSENQFVESVQNDLSDISPDEKDERNEHDEDIKKIQQILEDHEYFSYVISNDYLEIIQRIISKNLNTNQIQSGLKAAIKKENIELIKHIINHYPTLDVNKVDNDGNSLLNYAITQGNPDIITLIKSRQNPLNSDNLDLPAYWSWQVNIMSRALALGECGLVKWSEDPFQSSFQKIPAALGGKDCIILYEGNLYYADQKQEMIQKIEPTPENQSRYDQLKIKISSAKFDTLVDNEILQLIASVIGHTPGGYKKNVFDGGVCFGISHMAMQAFMANDYENFYRRMQLISSIPANQFNEKICGLEEKRSVLTRKARKEFNKLSSEDKSAIKEENKEKISVLKMEISQWRVGNRKSEIEAEKYLNKRIDNLLFSVILGKKIEDTFSKDDLLLLDARTLFEGIALYQEPYEEYQLFNKISGQDVLVTAPVVQSKAIEKQQGVVKLAGFCGAYDSHRMSSYFVGLQEAINNTKPSLEKNITLSMGSSNHRIVVNFDPNKKKWYLVDPNGISKPFSVDNVIEAFSDNGITVFSTEIFSTQADSAALNPIVENWMQGEEWKAAHHIDDKTSLLTDSDGVNLLYMAIKINQTETIKELLQNPLNLNKQFHNGMTPLHYAIVMNKGSEIINILLEKQSILNIIETFSIILLDIVLILVNSLFKFLNIAISSSYQFGEDKNNTRVHQIPAHSVGLDEEYKEKTGDLLKQLESDTGKEIENLKNFPAKSENRTTSDYKEQIQTMKDNISKDGSTLISPPGINESVDNDDDQLEGRPGL